jgi:hypothetical protein
MRVLKRQSALSERQLIDATGLTKTQLLCSLETLIDEGSVKKMADKKYFAAIQDENSSRGG